MAFTDEQLGMLNALMYENESNGGIFRGREGQNLHDIVEAWKNSDSYDGKRKDIVDTILNDPNMGDLVLMDIDSYAKRGSQALCFKSASGKDDDTYVVFKGTGTGEKVDGQATNSEWYTDALGMCQSDTEPQRAARNYVEYAKRRYGGNVTVTGHSNGANKAMYAAITSGAVYRCVAFDGQGFSPAFFDRYQDEIDRNSPRVTFYGLEGDYVGPLLLSLPIEKRYIKFGSTFNGNPFDNLMGNHYMESFFTKDADGKLSFVSGEQSAFSKAIEDFVAYLYKHASYGELAVIAPFVGELLDSAMGSKGRSFSDVLFDEKNKNGLALFYLYVRAYPDGERFIDAFIQACGDAMPDDCRMLFMFLVGACELKDVLSRMSISARVRAQLSELFGSGLRTLIALKSRSGKQSGMSSCEVRDFTEAKRQELLSIVREVNAEPWFDPSRWDVWYRAERWFGRLSIGNYQGNMREYYRKTIDIEGTSIDQINRIFSQATRECGAFARSIEAGKGSELKALAASMGSLT